MSRTLYWVKGKGNLLHRLDENNWWHFICGTPVNASITVYSQKFLALEEQNVRGICRKCAKEALRNE